MKTQRIVATVALLVGLVAVAHASPIFGTWKGTLNGKAITVEVTYNNRQTGVKLSVDSHALTPARAKFVNAPPTLLRFEAENEDGKTKLVPVAGNNIEFELETRDGREATLRILDQGKTVETVKLVKTASAK